ncbi:MAG: single-stranded-DNA-specific exonuclease RecJ [Candidatus Taylorbacteria bacterium RIFCSPLOWO2_01_FULL_43_44]|uniref:Single-stranded-DNA-specific exonuclease RecJ n=1 Tax=Candidatus Taylorbacteria bacterium RIFCSPHIGHO2_02_FULL_43_32b TaxID=1802306 RepID=A0A1G2MGE5_9BACT|nr:MAG: single-stranded-DNA-specific exonuclease RecJ [Candidatus Taylorbacteria bacterium RIFCSPHIGHO2_01_FULL_43_47]OHA22976.1 MAG: single-stranded-DNA-specific exonuclease RecJ [Candidatus Taylorbacteria bacterium RIFCSPHIGHO2_02_FULL_43_32b]OHA29889.1 MAG: single-stranded-DNA-specific exonuclease RecJ [Candidatus Taylorbacteria bacterium RIFCSPLOWO2_01_FULL_43_44]
MTKKNGGGLVKKDVPKELREELKEFPELLSKLLFHRGIKSKEDADRFLNPVYAPHDPFFMKGMKEGVERLIEAFQKGERITIFSDYDADGIPGAVLMSDFFDKIGYDNFDVYIPDRHTEGFGLNEYAINEIADRKSKLIITIDCGVADEAEIVLAKSLGVEVIVTDHHTPTQGVPSAKVVIDPKQDGCQYPDKNLCGAGVAFKFVEASLSVLRSEAFKIKNSSLKIGAISAIPEGWQKWLLDMVGIATLSDMVPLVGENRMFAKYGLAVLRKSPRPGLNALFRTLRINRANLSEEDIAFSISPRINAASRMGSPMTAFRLLRTKEELEAVTLARELEKLNSERKGVVAGMIKEIKHMAKERGVENKKVIVMGSPSWRPALLGLAAGNVAEEYGRPVFLWGRDTETTLKGSCRGAAGVDILELMQNAGDIFIEFGGHAAAGGFSVALDRVHLLEDKLELAIEKCLSGNAEVDSRIQADHVFKIGDLDWKIISDLEKLSPFGVGNPKPVFLFEKMPIHEVRQFGKDNIHLALRFLGENNQKIEAISFFTSPQSFGQPLLEGNEVSLLAHVEQSNYGGNRDIRLRIVDVF